MAACDAAQGSSPGATWEPGRDPAWDGAGVGGIIIMLLACKSDHVE